ncbi:hypothetical protein AAFF_G00098870 [Aldrovandia affinis]|uniref:Uncharacterized protein n=1 Tax=Aldrovandia affinis TaxID=143900 RepID=A0AAD7RVE3_9TELE|nr:hypothetical protein AAFF_G00098870 [Aldrovandia affinis]
MNLHLCCLDESGGDEMNEPSVIALNGVSCATRSQQMLIRGWWFDEPAHVCRGLPPVGEGEEEEEEDVTRAILR